MPDPTLPGAAPQCTVQYRCLLFQTSSSTSCSNVERAVRLMMTPLNLQPPVQRRFIWEAPTPYGTTRPATMMLGRGGRGTRGEEVILVTSSEVHKDAFSERV